MKHPDNIEALTSLPIDYIGFIFYPKSPRFVQQAHAIPVPDTIKKVGVFVNETLENIRSKVKSHTLQAVQLHGSESSELCKTLQQQQLEVIKAFGIDSSFDWNQLVTYLDAVDYFLFDTKSPQHGGTGQTFDWEKLKEYPFDKPYFLSGGLSMANNAQAMAFDDERLIGLDLNSKFEIEPGLKDINLLTQALKIIKNEQISGK